MHLLVFAAYYSPHRGGYELYAEELASRLVHMGHQVTVVTSNSERSPVQETLRGVTVFRWPCWNILGGTFPIPKPGRQYFQLAAYMHREHVDLINTQTRFFLTSFFGWWFAKTQGLPLVHTEHGTRFVELSSWWTRLISRIYDQILGRLVISSADRIIASSRAAGEFTRKLGGKTFDLVYNGVDTSTFFSDNSQHQSTTQRLLFVGRLIAAKGVQELIQSFSDIQKKFPQSQLTIIGTGNYEQQLKILADRNTNIEFLQKLTVSELRLQYQQAQVFINPSFSEGLPTSVLEAIACGSKVAATDVGGTKEIVEQLHIPASQMIVIPPHDKQQLIDSVCRLLSDTSSTPIDMAPFSWQRSAENFVGLLQQTLAT